jgi:AcrR family transcriptional regulator
VIAQAPQARTRLARRAVVDAAASLFAERGYPATTIEAISERSDVPPATVYRLFASKVGILKAILDAAIVGDEENVALTKRPQVQSLLREPDARTQLAGFARISCEINARTHHLYRLLTSAAESDSEAALLLAEQNRQRQEGQAQIAHALARSHALKHGLKKRDAADIIHALMSPEMYRLLVIDRGWRPDRYEQWLSAVLAEELLEPPLPH